MTETASRRGRPHDAEGAQEAILNAAEEVFAEHGFDGARIDAIAAAAGYNRSLLFHYFDDKLGLYAAVLRRVDKQINGPQADFMAALLDDEVALDAQKLRAVLRNMITLYLDYLLAHPRVVRMLNWELAEGWQTLAKIISQRDREDFDQFRTLLARIQEAGLLRPELDPALQIIMAVYFCQYYLGSVPLYQMLLPGEDVSSPEALVRTREYVIDFILGGMMIDPIKAVRFP